MFETKVSLLIPTMNRPDSLKRTIESYMMGNRLPDEIVVVDQSNPGNEKLVREALKNFETKVSIGFFHQKQPSLTKARNRAVREASYDLLIMSDDDVEANIDTIKNTIKIFEDSEISMMGGIDENTQEKQTKIGYILGTKSWIRRKTGHVAQSMLGRYPDVINGQIPTEWVIILLYVKVVLMNGI